MNTTTTASPSLTDAIKSLETRATKAEAILAQLRTILVAGLVNEPVSVVRKTVVKAPRRAPKAPKAKATNGKGRGRPPKFDEVQSLALAREHASGKSINQLAQEHDATRQAVKHAIERAAAAATNTNGVTA